MREKIIEFIKKYKVVLISILITLLIEIFICNYGFFRTLFVGNMNIDSKFTINEKSVTISNIDSRITSIAFKYNNDLTDKITYSLSYTAEENSDKIDINPKVILANGKHYINFDTHSKCKNIQVNFLTESDLQINSIILNHPNINISLIRIIFIFIVITFFIKVKNKEIYKIEYDKNSKFQSKIFILNLFVLCMLIFTYILIQFGFEKFWINKDEINKEDSILMQTEAIVNGQIELMEKPSKELKSMENPYDNIKRDEQGIRYLYDVAYYNGNYYNYFGIAPIITSILPFRLITGMYTHTYIFNMIYMLIAIISLYFLYKKLINKYIEKISLCNFYLGFYSILFASNIFTLLRGAKYDIVVTSGIAFLLISLNLAISIYQNSKCKYSKLILLGISTALIVLSKPNLIVYYLLILFLCLISMRDLNIKQKVQDSIFILIPLGLFAIFQMFLNNLRFDSIFEFGAKYQLTGFNMTSCMSITFGKIYAGILEYLFKTPTINPLRFPFVFINTDTALTSINEVCYENRLIGLIAIPILYAYFLRRNVMKKAENKELNFFVELCIISSLLGIIINSCLGGICEAYSIDFKLILAIGAVLILLKWIEVNNENEDINKIFLILCVITIVIMIPISLTTENNLLMNLGSDTTAFLKTVFEFWT